MPLCTSRGSESSITLGCWAGQGTPRTGQEPRQDLGEGKNGGLVEKTEEPGEAGQRQLSQGPQEGDKKVSRLLVVLRARTSSQRAPQPHLLFTEEAGVPVQQLLLTGCSSIHSRSGAWAARPGHGLELPGAKSGDPSISPRAVLEPSLIPALGPP